ncbi:MAG: SH3 domain-containing protein [Candidatus Promineifilaceae bacterium]
MTLDAQQLLDAGMLILAGLFGLLGLLFAFQGLFGGRNRSRYGVGRLRARREAMSRFVQGLGLLLVALLLLGVWYRFQSAGELVLDAEPGLFATVEPTPEVLLTETTLTELPTPDVPTVTPMLTNTSLPEPEAVEAEVVETDSAETTETTEPTPTPESIPEEPTEEPTPAPTDTPTKPPYDAEVRVVGGVNLRDSPNGNVLILVEDGEGVFILEGRERAGRYAWQEVRTLDGTIGWVAEQFLVLVE